ncbi:solute carrier family 2, facilitated glucose transporter member 11-like isoform X4 [Stegostoma tigrinum]|uniref:solute carrier family 2, facilitated glucose transporter member 11-like isoform X4 n=1 Tax=Stegostoma tigrinum TaxID=3053191 RepID=UPI00286FE931|nr:solute carrier family 2, facilitated glucose transporter member 11-like isoform X4 [Stegostoma tigrinum]
MENILKELYIKYFINETWLERYGTAMEEHAMKATWSIIVSVYSIGAVFGSLIAGHLSVKYGRRNCLTFNNILTIAGALSVGFSRMARSFEMILVARFMYGVTAGNGLNVHCMYLMECSPKKLRGIVTITTAIFISIGKCLGQIIGLREILGSESVWPLLMAFNAVPAFIQLVTLPWFPESPRYLLIDKGNRALSMNALQRLWGKRDFSQELEEMQAERTAIRNERARSVWELCTDPSIRSQLLINMMMSFLIQLSGINAIYSYAFEIFQAAGIPDETIPYVSIGTGLIEMFTLLICAFLVERAGRKTLFCGGLGLMSLWTVLLTITYSLQHLVSWMPYCSLTIIFAYVFSYGVGPGGVAIILPSEIFLQSDRPAGYVINGFLNWFGLFLVTIIFSFMVVWATCASWYSVESAYCLPSWATSSCWRQGARPHWKSVRSSRTGNSGKTQRSELHRMGQSHKIQSRSSCQLRSDLWGKVLAERLLNWGRYVLHYIVY